MWKIKLCLFVYVSGDNTLDMNALFWLNIYYVLVFLLYVGCIQKPYQLSFKPVTDFMKL
jgi:hypothetical protein